MEKIKEYLWSMGMLKTILYVRSPEVGGEKITPID